MRSVLVGRAILPADALSSAAAGSGWATRVTHPCTPAPAGGLAKARPPMATLIPAPLIHQVAQRLALPVPLEIVQKQLHGALLPIRRMIGGMRRQEYVIQCKVRMARRQRLLIEDIQRRAADAPLP